VVISEVSKYTSIPYVFNGRSKEGCDCLGLIIEIFKDEQWSPSFDDGKLIEEQWWVKEKYRLLRYLMKTMTPIKNIEALEPNDVLYFSIGGEAHLGFLLMYGRVLTTFVPGCKHWDGSEFPSRSMIIHRNMWNQGFIAGFRRRS